MPIHQLKMAIFRLMDSYLIDSASVFIHHVGEWSKPFTLLTTVTSKHEIFITLKETSLHLPLQVGLALNPWWLAEELFNNSIA